MAEDILDSTSIVGEKEKVDQYASSAVKNELGMIKKRLADDQAKAGDDEAKKGELKQKYEEYKNAAIKKLTDQQKAIQKRCEAGKNVKENLKKFEAEISGKRLKELEFEIKKLKIQLNQKNKDIQDARSKVRGELTTI